MPKKLSKAAPACIRADDNRLRAFELRKSGASYRAIAQALGVSVTSSYRYVIGYLTEHRKRIQEVAADVRELELQRADDLFEIAYQQAQSGDLTAIDRCIRVAEFRARLLGLFAPEAIDLQANVTANKGYDLSRVGTEQLQTMREILRDATPDTERG